MVATGIPIHRRFRMDEAFHVLEGLLPDTCSPPGAPRGREQIREIARRYDTECR